MWRTAVASRPPSPPPSDDDEEGEDPIPDIASLIGGRGPAAAGAMLLAVLVESCADLSFLS